MEEGKVGMESKQGFIKTMSKELMEVETRLQEISKVAEKLKRKNQRREKDVEGMVTKADGLVKGLKEVKQIDVDQRDLRNDNSKSLNFTIGSRMMDYLLTGLFERKVKMALNSIRDFAKFDHEFFEATKRMVGIYQRKNQDKVGAFFKTWIKMTLKPSQTKDLTTSLKLTLRKDKKKYSKSSKIMTIQNNNYKESQKTRNTAQKLTKTLLHHSLQNLKSTFLTWKSHTKTQITKSQTLCTLLSKSRTKILKSTIKTWKSNHNSLITTQKCHSYTILTQRHLLLQSLFTTLHLWTKSQKHHKTTLKLKSLFAFKLYLKSSSHTKKQSQFLQSKFSVRENYLKKLTFHSWKLMRVESCLGKILERNSEEESQKLEVLQREFLVSKRRISEVGRVVETRGMEKVRQGLRVWKERVKEMVKREQVLIRVVKRKDIEEQRRAFDRWRVTVVIEERKRMGKTIAGSEDRYARMIMGCKRLVGGLNDGIVDMKTKGAQKMVRYLQQQATRMNERCFSKWKEVTQRPIMV